MCKSEIGFKRAVGSLQLVLFVFEGLCVGGGTIKASFPFTAELLVALFVPTIHVKKCLQVCDLLLAALQLVLEVQDFFVHAWF